MTHAKLSLIDVRIDLLINIYSLSADTEFGSFWQPEKNEKWNKKPENPVSSVTLVPEDYKQF